MSLSVCLIVCLLVVSPRNNDISVYKYMDSWKNKICITINEMNSSEITQIVWNTLKRFTLWEFSVYNTKALYKSPKIAYHWSNSKGEYRIFEPYIVFLCNLFRYYPAMRANTSIGPVRRAGVSIRCIGFFISTRWRQIISS